MNFVRTFALILFAVFFATSVRAQEGSSPTPAQPFRLGSTLEFKSDALGYLSYKETVESITLVNGQLEVVKQSVSDLSSIPAMACVASPCDWSRRRVWKEVYGVKNGKITLLKTIEGKIIPAQDERIEWPTGT